MTRLSCDRGNWLLKGFFRDHLLGQISASLAAMNRTIDDYDAMARREMIKAKQEKAQMCVPPFHSSPCCTHIALWNIYRRVSKFRADYLELRNQFEKYKSEAAEAVRRHIRSPSNRAVSLSWHSFFQQAVAQRAELISGAALPSPSDARRRFQPSNPSSHSTLHPGLRPQNQSETISESPFRGSTPNGNYAREFHALDEHTFIQNTSDRLDEFLAQGREVLDNLVDQRQVLKGTHKRLLDTANQLGLSRNVIVWIERRRCVPLRCHWPIQLTSTCCPVLRTCISSYSGVSLLSFASSWSGTIWDRCSLLAFSTTCTLSLFASLLNDTLFLQCHSLSSRLVFHALCSV